MRVLSMVCKFYFHVYWFLLRDSPWCGAALCCPLVLPPWLLGGYSIWFCSFTPEAWAAGEFCWPLTTAAASFLQPFVIVHDTHEPELMSIICDHFIYFSIGLFWLCAGATSLTFSNGKITCNQIGTNPCHHSSPIQKSHQKHRLFTAVPWEQIYWKFCLYTPSNPPSVRSLVLWFNLPDQVCCRVSSFDCNSIQHW
jgi:hypothetical protein